MLVIAVQILKNQLFIVAVDYFTKALSDELTNERARKSINTYSKYFPTKEECFLMEVCKVETLTLLNAG